MNLEPAPAVYYVLADEVLVLAGEKLWTVLPDPRNRLTLWVVGRDTVSVDLDLAAVQALLRMLGLAESKMQAAAADNGGALL